MSMYLVYKCTIYVKKGPCVYTEATPDSVKNYYHNHIIKFKKIDKMHSTALAGFVWQLKEDKIKYLVQNKVHATI